MAEFSFLDWAIDLLEQIENSQEKKAWCHHYSVYIWGQHGNEKLDDISADIIHNTSKCTHVGVFPCGCF